MSYRQFFITLFLANCHLKPTTSGRARVMIVTLLYLVVFLYYSVLFCAGPERICNFLSLSSRFYSSGLFSLFLCFFSVSRLHHHPKSASFTSLTSFIFLMPVSSLPFPLSLFHTNTRYPFISSTKKGIGMRRRLQTVKMKETTQTIEREIRQEYSINFLADGRKGLRDQREKWKIRFLLRFIKNVDEEEDDEGRREESSLLLLLLLYCRLKCERRMFFL